MNPPINARYLVETSYGDDGALSIFDADGLAEYLSKNIEREHYSGEADTLHGIYRYDSPGQLAELVLIPAGETRAGDFIGWFYRLHDKADADAFGAGDDNEDLGFIVRIDGRA
jgi:hypothetical protein